MKKIALIIITIMICHFSYPQGNSNYYYDGYNAHFGVNDSTSAIMIIKNMNNYTQISNSNIRICNPQLVALSNNL